MTFNEQIKAEIDKRYAEYREKMKTDDFTYYEGMADALDLFEQFIDTLEPEPVPADLEEAAENYSKERAEGHILYDWVHAFKAGAKWQAEHTPLSEDTVLFNKGVAEGKRLMMEEAVKWLVDDDYHEASEKGRFILGSVGLGYNGYYIPYLDLLKLPKED